MRDYSLFAVEDGKLREYAVFLADDDNAAHRIAALLLPDANRVVRRGWRRLPALQSDDTAQKAAQDCLGAPLLT